MLKWSKDLNQKGLLNVFFHTSKGDGTELLYNTILAWSSNSEQYGDKKNMLGK